MMKSRFYLSFIALIALSACNPTGIEEPDGPSIINPDDIIVSDKEALEPDAQKVKLEQVATKMIDLFPADEYEDVMEFCAEAIGSGSINFDESYDWSELEDVWEDIGEDFFAQEDISDTETRYFLYLFFSNFTGTVEFGEDKVTYRKGSDIKVIFNTEDGTRWEAEITPKKLKKVFLGEWMDEYYDFDYDTYEEVWYTEYYNVTVEVPSSLSASVKRDGKTFAEVSFSLDHNIGNDGVDIEKVNISFRCEVVIDDLKFTVGKLMYNAKKGDFEYSSSLYKGDIFIFSETVAANASINLDEDGYFEDWDGNKASFRTNILGEIQFEGQCRNIEELAELAETEINSEKTLERVVNNINNLIDINLYYDGTSTIQASVEMEPMVEMDSYYGDLYWMEPIIVFNDGSRYLFYEYFEEEDFDYLIQKFERLLENYENMYEDFEEAIDL